MTPPTIVFGREKKFRLGGTSFPTLEDFFLGPGSRTKYGYDADGNVLSQENKNAESLSNTYLYDAANRLINWAQGGTQMKTYSYDSVGNNIDSSSTGGKYNSDNEETTINNGGLQPSYDLAGNMQTLSNGDTAVYDAWGRLVEVDGTSGIVEQCEYDGTGRRVQVSTPTTVETDYYSGQQVIESDTTVSSVLTRYQYVWSPRYIDAPVCRDTLNGDGSVNLSDRIFYLGDANYNVTAVAQYNAGSGTWQVAERYSYDPYGKVTVYDTSWNPIAGNQSQAGIDNTIFYAGETFDSSTGLYYDRARYYDPQLGRFISQDPMGTAGSGANLYAYCGDNPTDGTDPSGMVDRPAKPFEYVPGAVNMRIGRPNRMRSSDLLQAEMAANAQPRRSMFVRKDSDGKECPYCTEIGWVQIQEGYMSVEAPPLSLAWAWALWHNVDWHVDGGIPYNDHEEDPSGSAVFKDKFGKVTMGDWLPFKDEPGEFPPMVAGYAVSMFADNFETHLMCLEGEEKNAVYGGFKWGFDFRLKTTSSRAYVTPGDYNFISYVTPMNEPTEEFKAIVRAYETGDVGFGGSIGTGD